MKANQMNMAELDIQQKYIVLHILEEKLDQGHGVYIDNFYKSVDLLLVIKLVENHTYRDCKDNPQES